MRNVILYIATSLDGFIAGPNHELDWLPEPSADGDDFGYSAFLETIDTTLTGSTTYDVVQKLAPGSFYEGKKNYVFSRQTDRKPAPGIEWIHEDPVSFTRKLKMQAGKSIWLVGGGALNTLFLKAGMIDEIQLAQFPVYLGSGIPLFRNLDSRLRCTTVSSRLHPSGAILSVFRKLD